MPLNKYDGGFKCTHIYINHSKSFDREVICVQNKTYRLQSERWV